MTNDLKILLRAVALIEDLNFFANLGTTEWSGGFSLQYYRTGRTEETKRSEYFKHFGGTWLTPDPTWSFKHHSRLFAGFFLFIGIGWNCSRVSNTCLFLLAFSGQVNNAFSANRGFCHDRVKKTSCGDVRGCPNTSLRLLPWQQNIPPKQERYKAVPETNVNNL